MDNTLTLTPSKAGETPRYTIHKRPLWRRTLQKITPLLFVLPALLLILFWVYRPLAQTFMLSTKQWNLNPDIAAIDVGWSNFKLIFRHPDFAVAVQNTFLYIVAILPFSVIIPILLAIVTNNLSERAKNTYRAFFFLPMIMPPVAVAAVWRWLMHPVNGFINQVLLRFGLITERILFLSDEKIVLLSVVLIAGWKMIGFSTLMFSAGLTGIDTVYYEAASIDGHKRWFQTLTITLPLLSPTIIFMLMMSVLFTAQWTFAYIDVLTQGSGSSTNVYYLMWTYGFKNTNVGMSAAAAVVFFIGFGILALLFNRLSRKLSFYDN